MYCNELKNSNEIAKHFGIKQGSTIVRILKRNNIPVRSKRESLTISNRKRNSI